MLTPFLGSLSLLGIWPEKGQEDPLPQLNLELPSYLAGHIQLNPVPRYKGIKV